MLAMIDEGDGENSRRRDGDRSFNLARRPWQGERDPYVNGEEVASNAQSNHGSYLESNKNFKPHDSPRRVRYLLVEDTPR